MFGYYGIVWLLVLVLDVYAIYRVLTTHLDPGMKLVWILVILVLPLLGPILWFVIGARQQHA